MLSCPNCKANDWFHQPFGMGIWSTCKHCLFEKDWNPAGKTWKRKRWRKYLVKEAGKIGILTKKESIFEISELIIEKLRYGIIREVVES